MLEHMGWPYAYEQSLKLVHQYDPSLPTHFDQALLATRRGAITTGPARSIAFKEALAHLDTSPEEAVFERDLRKILTTVLHSPNIDFPDEAYRNLAGKSGYDVLATSFEKDATEKKERYQAQIEQAWPGQGSGLNYGPNGELVFIQQKNAPPILNLEVFRGIPLEKLDIRPSKFTSLAPLRGMPLKKVAVGEVHGNLQSTIRNLRALEKSPLEDLQLAWCSNIGDLSELNSHTNLYSLRLRGCTLEGCNFSALPLQRLFLEECNKQSGEPFHFSEFPLADLTDSLFLIGTKTSKPSADQTRKLAAKVLKIDEKDPLGDITLLREMPNLIEILQREGLYQFYNLFEEPSRILLAKGNQAAILHIQETIALLPGSDWAKRVKEKLRFYEHVIARNPLRPDQLQFAKFYGGNSYITLETKLSWTESEQIANALGGSLIVCETPNEAQFTKNAFDGQVWLGARSGPGGIEWINKATWEASFFRAKAEPKKFLALKNGEFHLLPEHTKCTPIVEIEKK